MSSLLREEPITARSNNNSNLTMISPKFQGQYVNKNEIKTKPFVYPVPIVYKKVNLALKDNLQISRMENEILQYQEHQKIIDEIQKNREH